MQDRIAGHRTGLNRNDLPSNGGIRILGKTSGRIWLRTTSAELKLRRRMDVATRWHLLSRDLTCGKIMRNNNVLCGSL
jgi:hypothetical protein